MVPPPGQKPALDLSRLRCLVVDDNEFMRTLLRELLHALGLKQVMECVDGEQAFKTLQTFQADLLLADLLMEPVDGITFTKRIRLAQDSPNRFLPIIMVSGHSELQRVELARDAGVNEFLVKPVSPQSLYRHISSVILTPRQFVRTPDYFGPDRRRRQDPDYKGPERRLQKVEL
jgi:two-component system, chemotaxis family, chemotaxis protein CheY